MEELSQHILDLARNSLEAGADKLEISVSEDTAANILEIMVRDNGPGIANEDIPKVLDAFYTTKSGKRVGLGVPLLMDAAERCGGYVSIKGMPPEGTIVAAAFPHRHPDRAPLGDISGTLNVIMAGNKDNKDLHLIYSHQFDKNIFIFDSKQLSQSLGDIPLQTPAIMVWLNNYLAINISDLREVKKIEEFGRTG